MNLSNIIVILVHLSSSENGGCKLINFLIAETCLLSSNIFILTTGLKSLCLKYIFNLPAYPEQNLIFLFYFFGDANYCYD